MKKLHCGERVQFDKSPQFGAKFIPVPQAMKFPDADDQRKELKGSHPGSTKREEGSPFCYIDGHLSSQKCGVRTMESKYKGRVVPRGDIVEDDSGADAVFREQGSSESQTTAA